jgi:integrase
MTKAFIFLRGNAWYASIRVNGTSKQIALKLYGGEADRANARVAADAELARIREAQVQTKALALAQQTFAAAGLVAPTPTPAKHADLTVSTWWDEYDRDYCEDRAPRTLTINKRARQHWEPLIGAIRLVALEQADLVKAQNRRLHAKCLNRPSRTVSESTVCREVRLINAILNVAVANRRIAFNPFKGAPKLEDGEGHAHRVLTEADEQKVYALFETGRKDAVGKLVTMDLRYKRFIRFLILTGCRLDEVLNGHFIRHPTWIRVVGKGQKPRELGLVAEAQTILDEQMRDKGDSRSPRPKGHKAPWWQNEQRFREVCATLADRAGIPHFSPHDLRHTFGHRWLKAGRDIKLLSLILGHASVAVTEKHYAYLSLSDVRARMMAVMEPEATP